MKKLITLLLAAVLLVSCFTGCGTFETVFGGGESDEDFLNRNNENDSAVVVILGNHANAVKLSDEAIWEVLEPILEKSVTYSYDEKEKEYYADINLSVIISDGNPERVELMAVKKSNKKDEASAESEEPAKPVVLSRSATTISRLDKLVSTSMTEIERAIASDDLMANDPEVDLVAAMNKAVNILRAQNARESHIVVFDTGVTTAGYLDMRKLSIQRDTVEDVLNDMQESCFVDLEGINMTFVGLGNTCGSQIDIRQDRLVMERLLAFWDGYFKKCKATMYTELAICEEIGTKLIRVEEPEDETESGEPAEGTDTATEPEAPAEDAGPIWPMVSNVAFKMSPLVINNGSGEAPGVAAVVLNSTSLSFKGDSAEFKDPAAAEQTLMSYEDTFAVLQENPDILIYVVGSIAVTQPNVNKDTDSVSAARAEAVKQQICTLYGISESQIVTIDAGTRVFSWRDADEFPGGVKDPSAQQENRVVAIIPATAPEVAELKEAGLI